MPFAARARHVVRRVLRVSAVVAWLGLVPETVSAGPWTREPGSHYLKLGQSVFAAEGYRDATGNFVDGTKYLGLNTFVYGELGLLRYLQTQLYLPYSVGYNFIDSSSGAALSCVDDGHPVESTLRATPGDALLGLQASTPWLGLPHAARLNVKVPMYDVAQPGGRCGGLFAQPGDGQLDLDLWLSLGESFAHAPVFLFGEVGHRFRTEAFVGEGNGQRYADTFLAFGQLGIRFMADGFVMLNLNLALPYRNDAVTRGSLAFGPALMVPLGKGFALEASIEATPWARNSASGRGRSLFLTGGALGLSHRL